MFAPDSTDSQQSYMVWWKCDAWCICVIIRRIANSSSFRSLQLNYLTEFIIWNWNLSRQNWAEIYQWTKRCVELRLQYCGKVERRVYWCSNVLMPNMLLIWNSISIDTLWKLCRRHRWRWLTIHVNDPVSRLLWNVSLLRLFSSQRCCTITCDHVNNCKTPSNEEVRVIPTENRIHTLGNKIHEIIAKFEWKPFWRAQQMNSLVLCNLYILSVVSDTSEFDCTIRYFIKVLFCIWIMIFLFFFMIVFAIRMFQQCYCILAR